MPGEQLLLINPRRKRRKNPKRRARVHRRRARAKNPRRRRRVRSAGGYRIRRRRHRNPRARHHRRRHRNPIMRRRRHRYRNPMSVSGLKGTLVPAAVGAAGGLALDVVWSYLSPYVPATFTSNAYLTAATKIAAAFGLGLVARKFLGQSKGNAVMAGAVTIQVYSFAKSQLSGTIPGLSGLGAYMHPMSGLGSPNPAQYLQRPGMGRVGRVGAYMKPLSGLGGLPFGGLGSMSGQGNSFDMFDAM